MYSKVLFICKKRSDKYGSSSGLFLSSKFISDYLNTKGVDSKVSLAIDANCIDKEVTEFKPTHVIIEALWVTPEKLEQLTKLHPKLRWYVRIHSQIPFLATEGIAFEWLYKYQEINNVRISDNNEALNKNLKELNINSIYLPNIYFPKYEEPNKFNYTWDIKSEISIACFGAIRSLKNQLIQASAAIKFANDINKKLNFHINSTRIEQQSESVIKNLHNLFKNNPKHKLIGHEWQTHEEFLKLVRTMDMGMQVSFSETFNIVSADYVYCNIPVVVSNEVSWMPWWTYAYCTNMDEIVSQLKFIWNGSKAGLHKLNRKYLECYNKKAMKVWDKYI